MPTSFSLIPSLGKVSLINTPLKFFIFNNFTSSKRSRFVSDFKFFENFIYLALFLFTVLAHLFDHFDHPFRPHSRVPNFSTILPFLKIVENDTFLMTKGSLDEHHQERSESPRIFDERLAMELRNRLYFIPRAQKAFHDPEEPSKETSQNEINGGCVSPISPRAAVIVVDCHHDFVILYSTVGRDIFDDYPFSSRSPRNFEWFLGFGLSYKNQGGRQVTHRSGRICSVMDYRGQMLASASIDGDSGGPCYSEDRSLIGIMVSSTTTDPLLAHEYDRETMEEELRDASSSPADTWITPGNLIIEAFSPAHAISAKLCTVYRSCRFVSCAFVSCGFQFLPICTIQVYTQIP
ncbi:Protein CBG25657 [Caenorhabditis briggsae]|uniref:Protein CBG25657 n=1 Tax=Caenorhabditis briggsae TaxID=6238 RepID=B6IFE1_CAEBR|nr:Protein CBG25657 [Caenorhabditis briggsae]CAR98621.1 Protein CBG25657 [Caenorhabditis briggsae]